MDRNSGDRRKRSDATGRRLKRWLSSIALLVTLGLIIVPVLLAVHDETFQLDGDVLASTTTSYGSGTQTVDWDSLFNADGSTNTGALVPSGTPGFHHAKLDADFGINTNGSFNTLDGTTYTTGSKDTLSITPGWQCTISNNVNSKVDLMNVYAADYTDAGGNRFLYFGLERNVNTGDANIGFWFLQSDANCVSTGGTVAWTGHHSDGDLLIVSAFTKGGSVPGITAYRWSCVGATTGVQCDATGFLDLTPVANSGDCRDPLHPLNDPICAVSNTAPITTPWTTVKKTTVDNALDTGEFFEGGINLTQTGFGDKCFNTFVGDTRSSQSPTATIFDYARGTLGECLPTLTTQVSATTTKLPGQAVTDLATITVTGAANPDDAIGNVQFAICGPVAPPNYPTCTSTPSPGNITAIGSPVTLDNASCSPPSGSNTDGISCAVSLSVNDSSQTSPRGALGAGNYCFLVTATLTNYASPGELTNQTTECFTVLQLQPTMKTDQTWTVKDEATVAVGNGAGNLDGDLRFKLYLGTTCTGTLLYDSGNIAISGSQSVTKSTDDATSASGSLVFNSTPSGTPPQVSWLVTYANKNAGHNNVTEACAVQNSTLTINGDGTVVNTP